MARYHFNPEILSRQTTDRQQFEQFALSPHFSSFSSDPIGFITEALIASEPAWSELPGLAPLFLSLALDELEVVQS